MNDYTGRPLQPGMTVLFQTGGGFHGTDIRMGVVKSFNPKTVKVAHVSAWTHPTLNENPRLGNYKPERLLALDSLATNPLLRDCHAA
jgi:hypothetical protein